MTREGWVGAAPTAVLLLLFRLSLIFFMVVWRSRASSISRSCSMRLNSAKTAMDTRLGRVCRRRFKSLRHECEEDVRWAGVDGLEGCWVVVLASRGSEFSREPEFMTIGGRREGCSSMRSAGNGWTAEPRPYSGV